MGIIKKQSGQNTRSTPSDQLERWLGADKVAHISQAMLGNTQSWYGPPIRLLDVPGEVYATGDGDFIGAINGGYFAGAADFISERLKHFWRASGRVRYGYSNVGFASISDALLRASSGYSQTPGGMFNKVGPTGVVGVTSSLHKIGPQPIAGVAAAAAPGGTAYVDSDTGGMLFSNPASGTLHLVGADVNASVISNTLLLYDRIFAAAKTMASVANEAVTGVPTRYQSSTPTAQDYAGGNFLFVEVGLTQLAATAHNWGVAGGSNECLYRNQAGTDNAIMPVMTGNSGAIVHRLDHPVQQFFAPLASGDVGVMDLAQMRCSASVATGLINFVIGHPIGFMSFPVINSLLPFDWLTNRNQAPRIFNDAYLSFLEINKPATTTTTYTGQIYTTGAAA
jgi:hypothetical protein